MKFLKHAASLCVIAPSLCFAQMVVGREKSVEPALEPMIVFFQSYGMRHSANMCSSQYSGYLAKFDPAFSNWLKKNASLLGEAEKIMLGPNLQDENSQRMRPYLNDMKKFIRGEGGDPFADEVSRQMVEGPRKKWSKEQLQKMCSDLLRQVGAL
jgi:hypothetical protein